MSSIRAAFPNGNPTDIYEPPMGDVLIKRDTSKISDAWNLWVTTTWQTLSAFLTAYGCLIPQLSTSQRDAIGAPVGGQMIYNTDTDLPQMFVYTNTTSSPPQGQWMTFTLV